MSNENTTASQMQHPELDIVDRLLTKPPLHTLTNADLCEAAQEIRDLRESVNDLTAWSEGVEGDNDTLRKEIARLRDRRCIQMDDGNYDYYDKLSDPDLIREMRTAVAVLQMSNQEDLAAALSAFIDRYDDVCVNFRELKNTKRGSRV